MTEPLYADNTRRDWIRSIVRRPGTTPKTAHLGLWYDKFFNAFEREHPGPLSELTVPGEKKLPWVQTAAGLRGDLIALRDLAQRRRDLVAALGGRSQVFAQDWHFVTGLGLPHPLENGFAWHPTLGLPFLPATSIKGMLRAWVATESDWDPELRDARLLDWFGSTEQAGRFIFFDALPNARVRLVPDVIAPHAGRWYAEGHLIEDPELEPERVPADWHSPNVVVFLAVEEGSYLVSVAPRDRTSEGAADLPLVLDSLTRAFDTLGAGAKTADGYGRWLPAGSDGEEVG